jgi:hypothetical protein
MEWTALAPVVALPITTIGAVWPLVRDRSSLARPEQLVKITDADSLSDSERHQLSFYRRRLARRVFLRAMVPRRVPDLFLGTYMVAAGPLPVIAEGIVLWAGAFTDGPFDPTNAVVLLITGVVGTIAGFDLLRRRTLRMRADARRILTAQRRPRPLARSLLGRVVRRIRHRLSGETGS